MINIEKLKRVCKKHDIIFLAIFGSYVTGEFTDKSDIDLLVKFSARKSLLYMVRIERNLSEFLKVKVDLLTEQFISPYIKKNIQKELKVVYDER